MIVGEWTYEERVRAYIRAGLSAVRADLHARADLGLPGANPAPSPNGQGALALGDAHALDQDALEAEELAEGDKWVRALRGVIYSFSQPRASKQTPGIADRLYCFPHIRIAFWWEAKSSTGRQRPDQKNFQRDVEACGQAYVLGTSEVLKQFLVLLHLATMNPDGSLEPIRQPEAL